MLKRSLIALNSVQQKFKTLLCDTLKIHRETLDGDRPAYYTSERAEINTGGITTEFAFVDCILELMLRKEEQSARKGHSGGDEELVQPAFTAGDWASGT